MLYYKKEEKMYQNRLQLSEKIGTRMYNREVRHGNIIFINDQEFKEKVKDKTIENHIKVIRRIPRKIKKMIKKKYGDMWLLHHPNTETVYNFS